MNVQFYEYCQNNSGGSFTVDKKVCHRLFIEASSANEANLIAESLGCYWNGCSEGRDCDCCGDRWSDNWSDDNYVKVDKYRKEGYEVSVYDHYKNPEEEWMRKYGKYKMVKPPTKKTEYSFTKYVGLISFADIEEYAQYLADEYGWTTPDARIFYKNGIVKEIFSSKTK
ncbi:hypothetical protein D3C81_691840 [compost metagenome]